ncbi:CAZyme family GH18 [Penicillium sp. IBT 35674x]|nr:CAZyme family GH18 [Penicillium sp. IBT 35674x]
MLSFMKNIRRFVIDAGETIEEISDKSNVARAAAITGKAGNATISVCDAVKDLGSAHFAILGVIMASEASVAGKYARIASSSAAGFEAR